MVKFGLRAFNLTLKLQNKIAYHMIRDWSFLLCGDHLHNRRSHLTRVPTTYHMSGVGAEMVSVVFPFDILIITRVSGEVK